MRLPPNRSLAESVPAAALLVREMPDQVYRDPGTYFEPFALRALGVVREEAELLEEAIPRFEAMDLHWHETQTVRFSGPALTFSRDEIAALCVPAEATARLFTFGTEA
jgi:hypothetical protein